MDKGKQKPDGMRFFVHLWQDPVTHRFWRGRVVEVEGGHSRLFHDARGLLTFVRAHLGRISDVVLPSRGGGP
jgi:hypothetical protein